MEIKFSKRFIKVLQTYYGITLEEYMQRFERTRPLKCSPIGGMPTYRADLIEADFDLYDTNSSYPEVSKKTYDLYKAPKILLGLKYTYEKIIKHDVFCPGWGKSPLFHKSIIERMKKICREDEVQFLPVIIKNLTDKVEPYEIYDYYIINVLNTINALDEDKSILDDTGPKGFTLIESTVFKEDPWGEIQNIAIDKISGAIIYHPRLAKAMLPLERYYFTMDSEMR